MEICMFTVLIFPLLILAGKPSKEDKQKDDKKHFPPGQLFKKIKEKGKKPAGKPGQGSGAEFELEVSQILAMRDYNMKGQKVGPYKGELYYLNPDGSLDLTSLVTDHSAIYQGDGFNQFTKMLYLVNEQGKLPTFPGPTIRVRNGERVKIRIANNMVTEATTMHWHGLWAVGNPYSDGVPMITMCPHNPGGAVFTYDFIAKIQGTHWYHSHQGGQRADGMYGPFIVYDVATQAEVDALVKNEIILNLQDYNHDYISIHGVHTALAFPYDRAPYRGTKSDRDFNGGIDGSAWGEFWFQSGIFNGKGRWYDAENNYASNQAPLTVVTVPANNAESIRFRLIHTGPDLPFRLSVDNHELTVIAIDGWNIDAIEKVESIIIHPGENVDYTIKRKGKGTPNGYFWIKAQTLEENNPGFNIAEAVLQYSGAPAKPVLQDWDDIITSTPVDCSNPAHQCTVFNCPWETYPQPYTRNWKLTTRSEYLACVHHTDAHIANKAITPPLYDPAVWHNYFLNIGLDPASNVNGKSYPLIGSTSPVLSEPNTFPWDECNGCVATPTTPCYCHHYLNLTHMHTIQFVMSNLGTGSGSTHPMHIHGHSLYVIKEVRGAQNPDGTVIDPTSNPDLTCLDGPLCHDVTFSDPTWSANPDAIPGINLADPPRMDTFLIPVGGYIIGRFVADNPGDWVFHCHMDMHAVEGMQVLLHYTSGIPDIPPGFFTCGNLNNNFPPP